MRMLIVDDSEVARMVLTGTLSKLGDVDTANDGLEAVERFRSAMNENKPYNLIFMDIMMPNMNGIDAVGEIRKIEVEHGVTDKKEAKIIMTSALSDPQIVIEAYYRGGANSYIVKPIDRKLLFQEMERLGCISEMQNDSKE